MGLWICHFFKEEEWAGRLGRESLAVARTVLDPGTGLMARSASRRLAFREFGTCLGVGCYGADEEVKEGAEEVVEFWHRYLDRTEEDLRPISMVMYAAALIPGGEYCRQATVGCNRRG